MYWSSDYRSGISAMGRQAQKSLNQLRQLHQLVFSFVNYYASNADQLAKMASDAGGKGHQRRVTSAHLRKRIASSARPTPPGSRVASGTSDVSISMPPPPPPGLEDVFSRWTQQLRQESDGLMVLVSTIDHEVLGAITEFIKYNEPQLRAMVETFNDLVADLEEKYEEVEKLRIAHTDALRLQEFKREKQDERQLDSEPTEKPVPPSPPPKPTKPQPSTIKASASVKYPIIFDTLKVADAGTLETLVASLIDGTPTTKRTLTLPGKSPDIFDSGALCKTIMRTCPSIQPTSMHLERFGQQLMDLKLIEPTSFWSKKFRGEDMWFEWTELACNIANGDDDDDELTELKSVTSPPPMDIQEITEHTTKRITSMFNSMKTSFQKTQDAGEVEKQYAKAYLDLQKLRHRLDMEILTKSQALEQFERLKIELIYRSLTRLAEVCYKSSVSRTDRIHELAADFVERFNREENYERDLKQVIDEFSVGIFFPSNVSPQNLEKKVVTQANNTFQNLKSQFNLYIDIPLQIPTGSVVPDVATGLISTPYFMYKLGETDVKGSSEAWAAPIDHQSYWRLKQVVIEAIEAFTIDGAVEITQESALHQKIIDHVIDTITDQYSADQVVNFIKNWLLELSDSVIPSMVYDSIIQVYTSNTDELETAEQLTKILGTIPRANLSALVYILEQVVKAFDLASLAGYPEKLGKNKAPAPALASVVSQLNSMEAVGAVPFMHMIMRPQFSKTSTGFKPPLAIYSRITAALLVLPTRERLFGTLLTNEKNYQLKKQKQRDSLPVAPKKKQDSTIPRSTSTRILVSESSPVQPSSSSRPSSADFAPRPFKTKLTPQPSPSASPKTSPTHTPRNSVDLSARSRSPAKRVSLLANAEVKIETPEEDAKESEE
ncbi:hypothetical protein DIURU_005803 [Diutina rugosa]|uniref:Rho-GAP domain-containing protein n=1 Tax=Diutina rugosa TaxID=5481 RepID=A0A642UBY3_DIURU|nr:uncharacterized protein DIURU_005803 [Diutina rugosa]KAA8896431.1 hypothetical protein DIURU_005803 [Diutina rugosa]